jgi:hypothetical protein
MAWVCRYCGGSETFIPLALSSEPDYYECNPNRRSVTHTCSPDLLRITIDELLRECDYVWCAKHNVHHKAKVGCKSGPYFA